MFKKLQKPQQRGFYAWNKLRAGDFLIYKDTFDSYHEFLYIPGGDPFRLTKKDFDILLDQGRLTLVEQLPEAIYNETIDWVKKNVDMSNATKEGIFDECKNTKQFN